MRGVVGYLNDSFGLGLYKYEREVVALSLLVGVFFVGLSMYDYLDIVGRKKQNKRTAL